LPQLDNALLVFIPIFFVIAVSLALEQLAWMWRRTIQLTKEDPQAIQVVRIWRVFRVAPVGAVLIGILVITGLERTSWTEKKQGNQMRYKKQFL
jgi:hypothetical protein